MKKLKSSLSSKFHVGDLMKVLSIKDLEDVVVGATFLGSGGGGSPENGLKLVEEMAKVTKEVRLASPDEVPDNEHVAMIAGMGAPKALKEKSFGPEALHAFDGLQRLYSMIGVSFKYVMPGETGGFNSITPIYVAVMRNLIVVDADGTGGRAVPELGTTLYNLYGLPVSPFVVADKNGNVVVGWLANSYGWPYGRGNSEARDRRLRHALGLRNLGCDRLANKEFLGAGCADEVFRSGQDAERREEQGLRPR
jgi:hypothetical protein